MVADQGVEFLDVEVSDGEEPAFGPRSEQTASTLRRSGLPLWLVALLLVSAAASLWFLNRGGSESADDGAPAQASSDLTGGRNSPATGGADDSAAGSDVVVTDAAAGVPIRNPDGSWIKVEWPKFESALEDPIPYQLLFSGGDVLEIIDVTGGTRITLGRDELADLTPLFATDEYLLGQYHRGANKGAFAAVPLLQLTSVAPHVLPGVLDVARVDPGLPVTALDEAGLDTTGPDNAGPDNTAAGGSGSSVWVIDEGSGGETWHRVRIPDLVSGAGLRPHEHDIPFLSADPFLNGEAVRKKGTGPVSPDGRWLATVTAISAQGEALWIVDGDKELLVHIGPVPEAGLQSMLWLESDVAGEVRRDISILTRQNVFVDGSR